MIIVSGKIGEFISLSNNVNLFILEIHGDQVSIGIDAEPETIVMVNEVVEKKIGRLYPFNPRNEEFKDNNDE